jgi:hypothetical protein
LALAACAFAGTLTQVCGSSAGDCGSPGSDYWSFTQAGQFRVLAVAMGGTSVQAWANVTSVSDFTLTVFGGAGHLLVTPCLSASQSHTSTPFSGSGSAAASLGGIGVFANFMSQVPNYTCAQPYGIDFIFGVPQTLTLSMSASATGMRGSEEAGAGFELGVVAFLFRDEQLRSIPGVTFTFAAAAVPEPGTLTLLVLALAVLGAKSLRR